MGYPSTNTPESREVRVFLSSTFRDFMEERELLVKQVFPALNRRARERGVEVVEARVPGSGGNSLGISTPA